MSIRLPIGSATPSPRVVSVPSEATYFGPVKDAGPVYNTFARYRTIDDVINHGIDSGFLTAFIKDRLTRVLPKPGGTNEAIADIFTVLMALNQHCNSSTVSSSQPDGRSLSKTLHDKLSTCNDLGNGTTMSVLDVLYSPSHRCPAKPIDVPAVISLVIQMEIDKAIKAAVKTPSELLPTLVKIQTLVRTLEDTHPHKVVLDRTVMGESAEFQSITELTGDQLAKLLFPVSTDDQNTLWPILNHLLPDSLLTQWFSKMAIATIDGDNKFLKHPNAHFVDRLLAAIDKNKFLFIQQRNDADSRTDTSSSESHTSVEPLISPANSLTPSLSGSQISFQQLR